MSDNKKNYDNGNVILVASEPSKLSRRYTIEKLKQLRVSSQVVLKALNEINDTYPHGQAGNYFSSIRFFILYCVMGKILPEK